MTKPPRNNPSPYLGTLCLNGKLDEVKMMLTYFLALVSILVVLFVLFVFYLRYSLHEDLWVKGHAPVDYLQTSQPSSDPWRWRKPSNKLGIPYHSETRPGIQDAPHVSSLVFRPAFLVADITSLLAGIALISFDLLLIFNATVSIAKLLLILPVYLILFCLGLCCLQYGDRVLRIDLYPDYIKITSKFANFFPRTNIYTSRQLLGINSKLQSVWMMENGQIQPDYKIILKRSPFGYFPMNHTFRLHCDPTQGSWIVGGLMHWKSIAR